MKPVAILYFSDLLCVWAYVAQARLEQLQTDFSDSVEVLPHAVTVFGNVPAKLEKGWGSRGGAAGYAGHVKTVVADFGHVAVHDDVWVKDTPVSSMPAHLFVGAVRELEMRQIASRGAANNVAWALRRAFFEEARDISRRSVQFEIAEALQLPTRDLERSLECGQAHAALWEDTELVKKYGVTLSPSLVLNDGRQRLNGNVGYRVIEANVREFLQASSPGEASWC